MKTEFDAAEPVSYKEAHKRVRRVRGRAKEQRCVECGEQAHQWALRHDSPAPQTGLVQVLGRPAPYEMEWSGDPQDYLAMCRGCHVALDQKHRVKNGRPARQVPKRPLRTHCVRGNHELTEDNVFMGTGRGGKKYRACRKCRSIRDRENRAAKRVAA